MVAWSSETPDTYTTWHHPEIACLCSLYLSRSIILHAVPIYQAIIQNMDIDTAVAKALEEAQGFWTETGHLNRAKMRYMRALGKALEDMSTEFAGEAEDDQEEQWLIELHTLMVFAYSQHNGEIAVSHYTAFNQTLYNFWCHLDPNEQNQFGRRASKATNDNPGINLITRTQPHRHSLLETAVTVTTQFYGYNDPASDRSRAFWERLQ
jgi:hypothetical protein